MLYSAGAMTVSEGISVFKVVRVVRFDVLIGKELFLLRRRQMKYAMITTISVNKAPPRTPVTTPIIAKDVVVCSRVVTRSNRFSVRRG